MPEFEEWESFYVIVGAAAGALIGLQFVVMTLIAERPPQRASEAGPAFSTPSVVHFSVALLLSALLRAPFHTSAPAAVLWGLVGFGGAIYTAIVMRRIRRQSAYQPDMEDWICHGALPFIGYIALAVSPFAVASHPHDALIAVAGATLLLLFVGVHNTWDAVSYQVLVRLREQRGDETAGKP